MPAMCQFAHVVFFMDISLKKLCKSLTNSVVYSVYSVIYFDFYGILNIFMPDFANFFLV